MEAGSSLVGVVMTDPLQLPMDDEDLDAWFPRSATTPGPLPEPVVEQGVYPGIMTKRSKPTTQRTTLYNPHEVGKVGEGLTRYVFEKFGATLSKSQTQEIPTDEGFRYISTDLDEVGSIRVNVGGQTFAMSLKVESKGWTKGTLPISRISDKQRKYFTRGMNASQMCVLSLVVWPMVCQNYGRSGVDCVYLVTWQRWLEIERELQGRAKGNYKGRSLRRKDLDLLDGCKVERVKRRWTLCDRHWLTGMIKGGK